MNTHNKSPEPDVAFLLEQACSPQERFQIMYTVLRDRICMLVYPPGTQLGEEALAAEFGISRSPLRKALQILEADGLLLSQQGVGTLVTDIDLDALEQVYRLRMELNEMTGRLAPCPVDADLAGLFETMRARAVRLRAAPDLETFARLNIDFFHAFQQLTENQPLRDVSEKLFYRTCRIWLKMIPGMDLQTEADIFCREIEDICNAVALGDILAAALVRKAHLSMGFTRLKANRQPHQGA